MIARELTPQEKSLWSRYFRCDSLLAISKEYNARTWPVRTVTEVDTAHYIGTFCYVFATMRDRQNKKAAK
jgi:hypothetical protein